MRNKTQVSTKKDLFIAPSIYTLFLYLLINDDWYKGDFALSKRIPISIHHRLKEMGIDIFSMPERKGISNIFYNIDYLKYLLYSKNRKYANIYGNDEFMLSCKYRKQGIKLIEDGPFNKESIEFFRKRGAKINCFWLNYWFYWAFKDYIPYGYDKKVNTIYHTKAITLSDRISSKGILIDTNKNWQNKPESEKTRILNLFGIDKEFIKNIDRYSSVLVTQELPIPEPDKIQYYQNIMKGIDESKILIKTHYAERTNYKRIFPKAMVINQPVPFQIFELLGYSPTKVMTICSSAIFSFVKENTEIVFLGSEIDDRIVQEYGIIRLENFINNQHTK